MNKVYERMEFTIFSSQEDETASSFTQTNFVQPLIYSLSIIPAYRNDNFQDPDLALTISKMTCNLHHCWGKILKLH